MISYSAYVFKHKRKQSISTLLPANTVSPLPISVKESNGNISIPGRFYFHSNMIQPNMNSQQLFNEYNLTGIQILWYFFCFVCSQFLCHNTFFGPLTFLHYSKAWRSKSIRKKHKETRKTHHFSLFAQAFIIRTAKIKKGEAVSPCADHSKHWQTN